MAHTPPPYYPPPPPPRRSRFVAWFVAAAVAAALAGGGVAVLTRNDDSSPAPASTASSPPAPSPSATVSEACRTWIRTELLDDSDGIDATAGYGACGDLSDDELQTAIDEVTEELSAEITPSAG
ncbi:hypothetical protein AB0911_07920 [Streptomyces nigra]|uniref:hypothetical protein n=1 Tax=Streptomyces nigra TaxID=1827580 RepID=UPI003456D34B